MPRSWPAATGPSGGASSWLALQVVHAEQLAGVGPLAAAGESGAVGQGGKGIQRVLVGVFRVQTFAGFEMEMPAFQPDLLRLAADQVHLDGGFACMETGAAADPGRVSVAVKVVADAFQKVEVAGSGNVGPAVVAPVQHALFLTPVDPDQKADIGRQDPAQVAQEL